MEDRYAYSAKEGCAMKIVCCLCLGLALCLSAVAVHAEGLASSPNFIVTADDQATADGVLARAESLRTTLAKAWLGHELREGTGRTVITVEITGGANRSEFCASPDLRESLHLMRLVAPRHQLMTTLGHETCHMVLYLGLGGKLPRWADEGVAMFEDENDHGDDARTLMRCYVVRGTWPDLSPVLDANSFERDIRPFAIAHYFAAYLLSEKNPQTLFDFAVAGKQEGWDAAGRRFYGKPLTELQAGWQGWTLQMVSRGAVELRPGAQARWPLSSSMATSVRPPGLAIVPGIHRAPGAQPQ
jgi:hypothetical protein